MSYRRNARESQKESDGSMTAGFTPVAATEFLKAELPQVPHWMCWYMDTERSQRALGALLGEGIHQEGKIGEWHWARVPCRYPDLSFWGGDVKCKKQGSGWVGLLKIAGPDGAEFLIFAYLRFDRRLGMEYLVSTGDVDMLRRFGDAVFKHFQKKRGKTKLLIDVYGGPDITLDTRKDEELFLPRSLRDDIETQVYSFFSDRKIYKELSIPHRRGFLFTGPPGTGKTLMIRCLLRECYRKFRTRVSYLTIKGNTDTDDVACFFSSVGDEGPRILILEDLDSLTHETRITRASLLSQLDGLSPADGILVLGTTNHPERVDPALLDRPSRFDRVWMFPLPDRELRASWITKTYDYIAPKLLERIAEGTAGWSFAYLKELRVTAGIMAIKAGVGKVNEKVLWSAYNLLLEQQRAAKKGCNEVKPESERVGFGKREALDEDLLNLVA